MNNSGLKNSVVDTGSIIGGDDQVMTDSLIAIPEDLSPSDHKSSGFRTSKVNFLPRRKSSIHANNEKRSTSNLPNLTRESSKEVNNVGGGSIFK